MPAHSGFIRLTTEGNGDVYPLSERISEIVRDAGVERGVASVFVTGGTAAITTMDLEVGVAHDLNATLERLVPRAGSGDPPTPAASQIGPDPRAVALGAIVGPSESIPVDAGRLLLGTWQEVVLVEFDARPRDRTVLVTILS